MFDSVYEIMIAAGALVGGGMGGYMAAKRQTMRPNGNGRPSFMSRETIEALKYVQKKDLCRSIHGNVENELRGLRGEVAEVRADLKAGVVNIISHLQARKS